MDDVIQHDPNYRDAQLERLTVLYRTCTTQRQSGARTASFAAVELGLRDSDALFSRLPNDLDVVEYAVVFPLARLRQLAANLTGEAEDFAKAQSLLQQMLAARPESREDHSNLVAAYARMGSIQAELGAREKAFANYRTGVVELKAQVARFPGRYSHVGDVLGHPAFKNNGDTVGALNVKRRMVDLAESVFQVDSSNVCARSDLGILCASASFSLEPISAPFSRGQSNSFLCSWQKPPKTTPAPHKAWAESELASIAPRAHAQTPARVSKPPSRRLKKSSFLIPRIPSPKFSSFALASAWRRNYSRFGDRAAPNSI